MVTSANSSTSDFSWASRGAAATRMHAPNPLQAMLQQGVNPLQGGDPTAAFQQQAGAISQLPIMQKLMSDPGMLDRATQASPQLQALFSQSPQLAAMMQPDSLQNLLSSAQHTAQFQQHIAGKHHSFPAQCSSLAQLTHAQLPSDSGINACEQCGSLHFQQLTVDRISAMPVYGHAAG